MTVEDRVRWDEVFRLQAQTPFPAPDPLLLQTVPPAPPEARALDLCAGLGQNGLWLAEQGYATDIMDISRIALTRARTEATVRNVRNVNLLQVDVDEVFLQRDKYHVICVFRYLRRALFPNIRDSIVSGGRLVYETYNMRYLAKVPAFNRDFLLYLDELPRCVAGWHIVTFEETDESSRLVAIKP